MARLLGVDYGTRRIGLAVSVPEGGMALPLRVVEVNGLRDAVAKTLQAFLEEGADAIVVGVPLNMDGSRGPMAERAGVFISELGRKGAVRVHGWDERLTTREAERVLIASDVSRSKRRTRIDMLAAQLLLQSFLDSRQAAEDRDDEIPTGAVL